MLNILCVCGNGMGTSTLLKIGVKTICNEKGIDSMVESCSFGEALAYISNMDLIITSPEWANMLPPGNCVVATTKNLIDIHEVTKVLLETVQQYFPKELEKNK
jgi:PTS system ascorbate-specific IIB component